MLRRVVLCDALADDVALVVGRVLRELLAEVVPEGVCVVTDQTSVERTDLTESNAYRS